MKLLDLSSWKRLPPDRRAEYVGHFRTNDGQVYAFEEGEEADYQSFLDDNRAVIEARRKIAVPEVEVERPAPGEGEVFSESGPNENVVRADAAQLQEQILNDGGRVLDNREITELLRVLFTPTATAAWPVVDTK